MVKLSKIVVSLPFKIGSLEWEPDEAEAKAAWELYVELVTRISTQPLDQNISFAREALDSLYSLFGTTREVLRGAGPEVGIKKDSVGGIAVAVLNQGLRPFLSRWHTDYTRWQAGKSKSGDGMPTDFDWPSRDSFYQDLETLQQDLEKYAAALHKIATAAP